MNNFITSVPKEGASHLFALIKQLIKEKQYEGVALLFTSNKEAEHNLQHLPLLAMDIYRSICLENLNDKTNQDDVSLYNCAEELLKIVASHAPAEELLFELLALIESNKSEYVFTSALKALQILLLRQGDEKPRAFEWSLNSIYTRLKALPVPDYLREGYDERQQRLLEQDDQIENLLMYYITVGLFYDPLVSQICSQPRDDNILFRPVGISRRNSLCCFLMKLLGKPLSLLDLSNDNRKTNSYSLQCAKSLTHAVTKCVSDPIFLLSFAEPRVRFRRLNDEKKEIYETSQSNVYLNDDIMPLDSLAVYYYMVFVGGIDKERIPLVYHPFYIFESGLYLIHELMLHYESPLHEKALLLMKKLLQNLKHHIITVNALELEIHKSICGLLSHLSGYSAVIQIRKLGIIVLRQYILSFEDEAKYLILKNLLKSITHHGVAGYLIIMYKDLVANALLYSAELPPCFCGNDFRNLFLSIICCLPQGVETDLLENYHKIISSLNVLIYFSLKDVKNRTGFWDFAIDIDASYLVSLRKALDLSVAHYKTKLKNVESGIEHQELNKLKLLEVDVVNDKRSKIDMNINREEKLRILNQNLCNFDLMRNLLSRVSECLNSTAESIRINNNLKY